jgi:hypothetical protein
VVPDYPPPNNDIAYDRIDGARRESEIGDSYGVSRPECCRDAAHQEYSQKKEFFHNAL